eukprot:6251549-Pyramimonas_sp.AAC.1
MWQYKPMSRCSRLCPTSAWILAVCSPPTASFYKGCLRSRRMLKIPVTLPSWSGFGSKATTLRIWLPSARLPATRNPTPRM